MLLQVGSLSASSNWSICSRKKNRDSVSCAHLFMKRISVKIEEGGGNECFAFPATGVIILAQQWSLPSPLHLSFPITIPLLWSLEGGKAAKMKVQGTVHAVMHSNGLISLNGLWNPPRIFKEKSVYLQQSAPNVYISINVLTLTRKSDLKQKVLLEGQSCPKTGHKGCLLHLVSVSGAGRQIIPRLFPRQVSATKPEE